jgi:hypothetical protein
MLVADGARPDTFAAALDAGELPALARLRAEGGLHTVTTVFPSVTGPAYAPFLMGRYPGPVGLPGLRWFDRSRRVASFPHFTRSYVGAEMRKVDGDLDPRAPTVFELAGSSLAALSVIGRGVAGRDREGRSPAFALRAARTHFRGDVGGWLDIDRDIGSRVTERIRRDRPAITFCALTGVDKASHARGHDDGMVRDALRIVDGIAATVRADAEADGRWEAMHLWVVSDHGHSPVRAHDDLAGLLRSWRLGVIAHPWVFGPGRDVAVMVSGNAMANLYVDLADRRSRRWWPALESRWGWLADRLLERDSVDLLILPHSAEVCEVRARGRGSARIVIDGGLLSHFPETGDPLGVGELRGITASEAHEATWHSDYPDALVQVAHLAGSARSGDLILSAARDWDFRARWEPIPHRSSHGALHREHMLVPLLLNRPGGRTPLRTVDVMPSALAALHCDVPNGLDGDSFL